MMRLSVFYIQSKYLKNSYSLCNRNCEYFANMAVYGINYSAHRSLLVVDPVFNNGKDSTIKLTEEMKESNEKLGYSRADH